MFICNFFNSFKGDKQHGVAAFCSVSTRLQSGRNVSSDKKSVNSNAQMVHRLLLTILVALTAIFFTFVLFGTSFASSVFLSLISPLTSFESHFECEFKSRWDRKRSS